MGRNFFSLSIKKFGKFSLKKKSKMYIVFVKFWTQLEPGLSLGYLYLIPVP